MVAKCQNYDFLVEIEMKYKIDMGFFDESNLTWLNANTIFLCVHGSHAYGSNTPESDIDIRGIAIPPRDYMLGFTKNFEQATFKFNDITIFGLKKFFQLAAAGNPNVLELLFVNKDEVIRTSKFADLLIENRHLFLSKKIRYSMEGYAHSQLKRLKGHYQRFTNPILEKPKREDFGLGEEPEIKGDQIKAFDAMIRKKLDEWNIGFEDLDNAAIVRVKEDVHELMMEIAGASIYLDKEELWKHAAVSLGADSNFIEIIQKEKEYKSKVKQWKQYQDWLKNRNPKRALLEAKHCFDTKHASHLYRLYSQCEEILTTGTLSLKNTIRSNMMQDIRAGKWSYDDLMAYVDRKSKEIDAMYKESKLQHSPNYVQLNRLYEKIVCEFLNIE